MTGTESRSYMAGAVCSRSSVQEISILPKVISNRTKKRMLRPKRILFNLKLSKPTLIES